VVPVRLLGTRIVRAGLLWNRVKHSHIPDGRRHRSHTRSLPVAAIRAAKNVVPEIRPSARAFRLDNVRTRNCSATFPPLWIVTAPLEEKLKI